MPAYITRHYLNIKMLVLSEHLKIHFYLRVPKAEGHVSIT